MFKLITKERFTAAAATALLLTSVTVSAGTPLLYSCANARIKMGESIAWVESVKVAIDQYGKKYKTGPRAGKYRTPMTRSTFIQIVGASTFCKIGKSRGRLTVKQWSNEGNGSWQNTRITLPTNTKWKTTPSSVRLSKLIAVSKLCGVPYEMRKGGVIQLEGCTVGSGGSIFRDLYTYIRSMKIF